MTGYEAWRKWPDKETLEVLREEWVDPLGPGDLDPVQFALLSDSSPGMIAQPPGPEARALAWRRGWPHLSDSTLFWWAHLGEDSAGSRRDEVKGHLADCTFCGSRLADMASLEDGEDPDSVSLASCFPYVGRGYAAPVTLPRSGEREIAWFLDRPGVGRGVWRVAMSFDGERVTTALTPPRKARHWEAFELLLASDQGHLASFRFEPRRMRCKGPLERSAPHCTVQPMLVGTPRPWWKCVANAAFTTPMLLARDEGGSGVGEGMSSPDVLLFHGREGRAAMKRARADCLDLWGRSLWFEELSGGSPPARGNVEDPWGDRVGTYRVRTGDGGGTAIEVAPANGHHLVAYGKVPEGMAPVAPAGWRATPEKPALAASSVLEGVKTWVVDVLGQATTPLALPQMVAASRRRRPRPLTPSTGPIGHPLKPFGAAKEGEKVALARLLTEGELHPALQRTLDSAATYWVAGIVASKDGTLGRFGPVKRGGAENRVAVHDGDFVVGVIAGSREAAGQAMEILQDAFTGTVPPAVPAGAVVVCRRVEVR